MKARGFRIAMPYSEEAIDILVETGKKYTGVVIPDAMKKPVAFEIRDGVIVSVLATPINSSDQYPIYHRTGTMKGNLKY